MRLERTALPIVLAAGLVTGLWGIRWGLPGPERLRAFPERLRPTPEIARKLADAWEELYRGIRAAHENMSKEEPVTYAQGIEEVPAGWDFPPGKLANSYRSLLLQSESPDEKKSFIILSQMRPWRLEFKPLYVQYGGAFIYPLGAYLKAASTAGAFRLVADLRHYLLHPEDMGRMYLWGRLFILAFALGSLWVLYDMGRRLSGPATGLWAALFFALSPVIIANSHVLKPHPYAAFWFLAAARLAMLALEDGSKKNYRLCGLCAGVAAGASLTFVFLAALPGLAWLCLGKGKRRAGELRGALEGAGLAAALVLATNPFLFFSYRDYAWELQVYSPQRLGLYLAELIPFATRVVPRSLGLVLSGLAAAGLARAAAGSKPRRLLGLLVLVSFTALWLRFGYLEVVPSGMRLYYPVIGLAYLLGADLLSRLGRLPRFFIVGAILVDSGLRSLVYLENMRRDSGPASTRQEAAAWVENRVPAGSSIGLVRYPDPYSTPPFRYDLYRLVVFQSADLLGPGRRPDYLVVDAAGLPLVDKLVENNYDAVKSFPSFEAGWGKVWDESFFANEAMHIYRRKDLPSRHD